MQWFLVKFTYTACLNLEVSSSESDLSLDIFASTIFPKSRRAVLDSAGRNCRLSTPCVPVGVLSSRR
jgi:hypothetical protein